VNEDASAQPALRSGASGILLCDKPAGRSSHAVVAVARKAFGTRRAGHAGTLDPMATGVLVLAIGEGLKILRYLTLDDKRYAATIRLGIETDTLDRDGVVTASAAVPHDLTLARVRAAAAQFTGTIMQEAPRVSALKQGGVALHKRVRAGQDVQAPRREVRVHALDVLAVREAKIDLEVHCGKGFYVRSLARDLALALGSAGHLSALRRTRSGCFDLADAVPFAQLDAAARGDAQARGALLTALIPIARALPDAARVVLDESGAAHARHGRKIGLDHVLSASHPVQAVIEPLLLCDAAGELLALGRYHESELRVVRGLHA
jgi:tRNA pseudouridine55 synthase